MPREYFRPAVEGNYAVQTDDNTIFFHNLKEARRTAKSWKRRGIHNVRMAYVTWKAGKDFAKERRLRI